MSDFTERKILEATQHLRLATTNQDVLKRNDAKVRETERSLAYLEGVLRELQTRKAQQMQQGDPSRFPSGPTPQVPPKDFDGRGFSPDGTVARPQRKQYTNLDLIKADTPFTPRKISRTLHQLEFKLQVEKQYKLGIDKMAKLYQADGDKKSKADAEAKRIESDKKIQLLETALKRYRNLHVLDDVAEDDEQDTGTEGDRREKLRAKPLSGTLYVTVKGARELDHAPVVTRFRSSAKQVTETHVSIKAEGNQLARSHPSRTDRWNEDFEIAVEKANEIEIVLYDKQVSEPHAVPIGLLWIKITDLVDALRRQKIGQESQGGWVTANAMHGDGPMGPGGIHHHPSQPITGDINAPIAFQDNLSASGHGASHTEGIEAWFSVEPAGAIALQLNFVKENVRKRPFDAPLGGLGRQGAVRKRKGDVHEMNGHKFIQRQFYQLMKCAFCGDFLLNAAGYQCEDCRYTCHQKCYEKVVTKCISKSSTGEDEDKINHRIPHRFESITNIGANWCCHCGYMLPFGRKNARRCTECDITCHANCAHLVPDFCGMRMEVANELLRSMQDIKRRREDREQRRPPTHQPEQLHTSTPSLDARLGQMTLGGPPQHEPGPPAQLPSSDPFGRQMPMPAPQTYGPPPDRSYYSQSPPPPAQSPPYGSPPTQQMPPRPPGARVPVPYQQEHQAPPRPPPGAYDPSASGYGSPYTSPRSQPQGLPEKPSLPSVPQQQQYQQQRPPVGLPPHVQPQRIPPPQAAPQQGMVPPQHQQQMIQAQPQRQPSKKRKVGLDDFNFLAVLGKGNFGKVMLAEEKKTNGLYAIKVLKKEFIIDNDEVESTRSEKRVFLTAAKERHPFLLGLHSCFQTETRIYFVMEYVSGGDLMLHIQRKQFSLRQAKFYASEVLLALEYFHQNGIIYRDLKLDNILLTLDGHVKVADYGLCKEQMWYGQTTSTFCGTPEFMAPEILLEQRYGRAVDWWAFGVLTYEMLLGQSPFRGDDEDEIFDAILEDEPLYPITMPRDAVSILQKLLTRDPARRLGSGKEDAEEIKRQPFFKDVNWDDVFHKRIPPPYFPTISGSADTSNFDEEFTREQPTLTPVHGQLSSRDQAEFNGFSWVASWADI
ncbi:AGC/PKC protein kinase [Coprinopsis cinerea okayama7|uniref:protein kinase C n=1 Tax=Coprinopsis cinerea (strain Okayama-7 / 130 / ATCC MYA-4618 / FGSC 9003) TaxID=240176 RepID=A8NRE4_COPC7|nr:AGC/PKC protein kinase [Coprinopsis cinerea okayama7\|eukprot:XP_001835766.2 AGC/PKC protein kinase [Coprinopsis cinerea okayama7\